METTTEPPQDPKHGDIYLIKVNNRWQPAWFDGSRNSCWSPWETIDAIYATKDIQAWSTGPITIPTPEALGETE